MSDTDARASAREYTKTTSSNAATWRYVGDREAGDLAYCVRFGVTVAPPPTLALGGALAYPVPTIERRM